MYQIGDLLVGEAAGICFLKERMRLEASERWDACRL